MTMETILVLGGSFAGLGAAHFALKHTLPALPKKDGVTYNVTLVNPSKDFYFRLAGPRAIINKTLMPPSKYIFPIEPAFASYPKDQFSFIQGTATHVDGAGRTVSITTASGEQKSIPYVSLIIATGITTPSPLFTQSTDAAALNQTLESFHKLLPTAEHVVIGGGGPVGVETAGEIAEFLNGKPGMFASGPKDPKAKVTLVCGDKKMLPILRESLSKTAEKYLKRLGAEVLYNTKVTGTSTTGEGEGAKTTVSLSDGKTIEADIYIDATGVRPNSGFLPKEWLDTRNRVACNPKTLRVEAAGGHVYVVGDVGSYTRGGVLDQADAIPVALTNLKNDLISSISGTPSAGDRVYKPNLSEQQICPVGTSKGVGAFGGWRIPSIMVWMIKGRDYLSGMVAPQTLSGAGFKKEGKWTPEKAGAAAQARVGLSSG